MACPPPKPHPTPWRPPIWAEDARIEEHRDIHCHLYARCLDTAIRADWEGFTCQKCPLFHQDAAPRADRYAFDQPADDGRS